MAAMSESVRSRMAELAQTWDEAEAAIKFAEQVSSAVSLASINELRYAGRRAVDALRLNSSEQHLEAQEALLVAIAYARNARQDAFDAVFDHIARQLEMIPKRLRISKLSKEQRALFEQLLIEESEVARAIKAKRQRTLGDDRDDYREQVMSLATKYLGFIRNAEIAYLLEQTKEGPLELLLKRSTVLVYFVTLLAFLTTIAAAIVQLR